MIQLKIYDKDELTYLPFWRNFLATLEEEFVSNVNVSWTGLVKDRLSYYSGLLCQSSLRFDNDQMAEIFLLTYS